MHAQAGQLPAVGIQGAVRIEGAQLMQQPLAFQQVGLGRWLKPGERLAQAGTPFGELKHQRSRIGLHHRWRVEGGAALLLRRAPEPQGATGAQAAGSAGALLGTRQAGGHCDQALHAAHRIEAAAAAEPAVDHEAHAFDGERAFGNGGGQHHLAGGASGAADDLALFGQRQIAVQQAELHVVRPAGAGDGLLAEPQLPLAGQEHQHGFIRLSSIEPVGFQGAHHLGLERLPLPWRLVADAHRVAAAFAGEQRGFRQLLHQGLQVERG